MKYTLKVDCSPAALCAASGFAFAQKGETVKVAFIDPLSGPFANVGQNILKSWQFTAEKLSGARERRRREVRSRRLRQQGVRRRKASTP